MIYKSSTYLIYLIKKILRTNIHFHGVENLHKESPTLFVANHFTRFETFLMPYILYTVSDIRVRSLADHSIFKGFLGRYLSKLGTISTKDKNRNEIILGDLMTGRRDWLIYPEGVMLKNKKITKEKDEFILHSENREDGIHTGTAVLAMEAYILKEKFREYVKAGNTKAIEDFKNKYFIEDTNDISYLSTKILPVNITYVPIRPGTNSILEMADSLIGGEKNTRILEELEMEGNMLLHSEIHIRFDKPIDVSIYMYKAKEKLSGLNEDDLYAQILEKKRYNLTTLFMDKVYKNVLVNFDHLFALILKYYPEDYIGEYELKRVLFLVAKEIINLKIYHIHHTLSIDLYKTLSLEKSPRYNSALKLALAQGVLKQVDSHLFHINKTLFEDEFTFHTIRLKNTFHVILNEISLMSEIGDSVKRYLTKLSTNEIKQEVFETICAKDQKIFLQDYNKFYSVMYSKAQDIVRPFVLYNKDFKYGVVLTHGFGGAPREVKDLGLYLHKRGLNIYAPRLSGHGTSPDDLKDKSFEDWYDSFNRGFVALSQVSKKIFLIGFSTGGLISLLATARKNNQIDALIVINAALDLNDIRIHYAVPTMHILNNFLSFFNADIESIKNSPEYPDTNYNKHYISSINELRELMNLCEGILSNIKVPSLVLQGSNDPIVNPKSADTIFNKISSKRKSIKKLPFDRHVILRGKGKEKVFEEVEEFLAKIISK